MDNRLIVALEILGEYACELRETNGIDRANEVEAAMVALGAVSTLPDGPAPIVLDATRYRTLRGFPETTVFVRRRDGHQVSTTCEHPGEDLDRLLDRLKTESSQDCGKQVNRTEET